jgi:diguanylate cyclase (GGDEF)-like protein
LEFNLQIYRILLYLTVAALLLAARILWPRRNMPGGIWLFGLLLSSAEWSLTVAFELSSLTQSGDIFWSVISYPGVVTTMVFYCLFAINYSQHSHWISSRYYILLFIFPVLTVIAAATNSVHHWLWAGFILGPGNLWIYLKGPWLWVMVVYNYSLFVIGFVSLVRAFIRFPKLYRTQVAIMLGASLFPLLGNITYVFGVGAIPGLDLTPFMFSIVAITLAWNLLQFRFLMLIPVARDRLVEKMPDGVMVLDSENRLVDINPVMRQWLSVSGNLIGQPTDQFLTSWPELLWIIQNNKETDREIFREHLAPDFADVHQTFLQGVGKLITGRLIIVRDITARKRAENELIEANHNLVTQLEQIKTLEVELREQAMRDVLTGLFNRRYLEDTLYWEFSRAQREQYPISLVMFDIDQFKKFNDTYGHEVGDLVLKAISGQMREKSRASDIVCRYGGEELLLVLLNTSLEKAVVCAEKHRQMVDNLHIPYGGFDLHVTVSAGAASFPQHGLTVKDVIREADKALYGAKSAGRNCVRVIGNN